MNIVLISRKAWGARPPKGRYDRITWTRGVKVHYTGGRVDPDLLDDHSRCAGAVRGIQNGHMDGNGWLDIGYSLVVCPHRKVFVGRGPGVLVAANGAGLNAGHYAVLGLVGTSGLVKPPDLMLHGIRDAIEYLRDEGGAGDEIRGHRDGYATSCPGEALYAWVREGSPRPSAKPELSWTEELMQDLPTLREGAEGKHVKTVRALLFARGYAPEDMYSHVWDPGLTRTVNEFKRAHKLVVDGVWGSGCWTAALAA